MPVEPSMSCPFGAEGYEWVSLKVASPAVEAMAGRGRLEVSVEPLHDAAVVCPGLSLMPGQADIMLDDCGALLIFMKPVFACPAVTPTENQGNDLRLVSTKKVENPDGRGLACRK
jgi:hypothetical protein